MRHDPAPLGILYRRIGIRLSLTGCITYYQYFSKSLTYQLRRSTALRILGLNHQIWLNPLRLGALLQQNNSPKPFIICTPDTNRQSDHFCPGIRNARSKETNNVPRRMVPKL